MYLGMYWSMLNLQDLQSMGVLGEGGGGQECPCYCDPNHQIYCIKLCVCVCVCVCGCVIFDSKIFMPLPHIETERRKF